MSNNLKNLGYGLLAKAAELTQKDNCILCGKSVTVVTAKKTRLWLFVS